MQKIARAFRFALAGTVAFIAVHAVAAEVVLFSPQGLVKDTRQIRVQFSDPMVAFGDPRAALEPFTIQCPVPGKARWADSKNWVYDFDRDLPGGIECRFELKADLKTEKGKPVTSSQRVYRFNTGGPSIRGSQPYQGDESIRENQAFVLYLDAEAKLDTVEKNALFHVAGEPAPVTVEIVQGKEREEILKRSYMPWQLQEAKKKRGEEFPIVVLRAKKRFPSASKVTLLWGKGISTPSGVGNEKDQEIPYKTRAPFTVTFNCERESASAGCVPFSPMTLSFSAPVPSKYVSKIELKSGSKTWKAKSQGGEGEDEYGSQSYLQFAGPFPASTEFTITLPQDIRDDDDRTLENLSSFPLKVRTEIMPPLAKFASPFGIIESKAGARIPVTLRNVESQLKAKLLSVKLSSARMDKVLMAMAQAGASDYSRDRAKSIFEGAIDPISPYYGLIPKAMTIEKPNGQEAFEVVGIEMKDPGFYVLELESALLGNRLLGGKTMYVPTAVLVTNMGVHFKWGRESSVAWVTSLDSGKPVSGADVTVRDCRGEIRARGKSDSQGLAHLSGVPAFKDIPQCPQLSMLGYGGEYEEGGQRGLLVVTAEKGDDFSFVLSSWKEGIEAWRYGLRTESFPGPNIAHTVMDRTLLRAGETVHMRHFLRRHTMKGFTSVPESERPKFVRIKHSGSSQNYTFPLQWDATGSAVTEWKIPEAAKLGHYSVLMRQKDDPKQAGESETGGYDSDDYQAYWSSGSFRVEEFRVPLMKGRIVVAGASAGKIVRGKPVQLSLSVEYLAGGGASDLPVQLRQQGTPMSGLSFEDFAEFSFANGAAPRKEHENAGVSQVQTTPMKLDAAGGAQVALAVPAEAERPGRGVQIHSELEFTDSNGEVQTVSQDTPVYPSDRLVGLKLGAWTAHKDKAALDAAVVDLSGKAVADAEVVVEMLERKTISTRQKSVGGFYAYDHHTEIKSLGEFCKGKTNSKGRLHCEGKVPVAGNVYFEAKTRDGEGRESITNVSGWFYDREPLWFEPGDHDRMDVISGKARFESGETATFQVRMPFKEASVLVTVEREGVLDSFVTTITSAKPMIEVPIKPNYAPNVFISAMAVRGRVGEPQPTALVDLGKPSFKLGFAEIQVGWKAHELAVKVTPEREVFKVREKARAKIRVVDAQGKPAANGHAVVAVVDEGLLILMPNDSWKLLAGMMNPRGEEVRTSTAQMQDSY